MPSPQPWGSSAAHGPLRVGLGVLRPSLRSGEEVVRERQARSQRPGHQGRVMRARSRGPGHQGRVTRVRSPGPGHESWVTRAGSQGPGHKGRGCRALRGSGSHRPGPLWLQPQSQRHGMKRFIDQLHTSKDQSEEAQTLQEEQQKCLHTEEPERHSDKGMKMNYRWEEKIQKLLGRRGCGPAQRFGPGETSGDRGTWQGAWS